MNVFAYNGVVGSDVFSSLAVEDIDSTYLLDLNAPCENVWTDDLTKFPDRQSHFPNTPDGVY